MSDAARFLPADVIRRKRDGETLDDARIAELVARIVSGDVTDAQAGAFLMAVYLNGMSAPETVALTRAMAESGHVIDWSGVDLPGPRIDKHSTGGVGDKVSLVLAPLMAACGLCVPMISGRGLGHTGGTLDKLDAIEGYQSRVEIDELREVVADVGCAIVGQTAEIAPADGRLYAVRDVTGTVASIPLITASILSKKLAAGLQGLVMDVKTGTGAFMSAPDDAHALGSEIRRVAEGAGLPARVLITDMNQVLGATAGNALETREAIDLLTGEPSDVRLRNVVLRLGEQMLDLGGIGADPAERMLRMSSALADGRAGAHFARMVAALGGPADILERPGAYLDAAPVEQPVLPEHEGVVAAVNVRAVGMAIVGMGGGRARAGDEIDYAVGLSRVAGIGVPVGPERPLAVVHARTDAQAERAAQAVREAVTLADAAMPVGDAVLGPAEEGD